jgi:hypothetical protein
MTIHWQDFSNGDASGSDAASGLRYDITSYVGAGYYKLRVHNAETTYVPMQNFATLQAAKDYADEYAAGGHRN